MIGLGTIIIGCGVIILSIMSMVTYFTNINSIRAGDVIVLNDPHWFVVLERYSDGRLKVAEGNIATRNAC